MLRVYINCTASWVLGMSFILNGSDEKSQNLLRQSLSWNYDYYHALGKGAFKNDDHILRVHVTHCLDIIRQQLMCTVDVGVLGQVWLYPNEPRAYVDFNTRHMCRNFEAIRQWAEVNQLPEDTPEDYLQPPRVGDRIYAEIPWAWTRCDGLFISRVSPFIIHFKSSSRFHMLLKLGLSSELLKPTNLAHTILFDTWSHQIQCLGGQPSPDVRIALQFRCSVDRH